MFDANVYSSRRKTLLEKMKGESGIILFIGNVETPAQYKDNCYKWRQDSTWLYFFGIDEPRFAATIDLESGEETIYSDDFEIDDIIWMGPMPSVASLAEKAGVGKTQPYAKLSWTVSEALIKGRNIHFVPASNHYTASRLSMLLGYAHDDFFCPSKAGCPKASEPLVKAIVSMRLVKEQREIELIDAACILGQKMHTIARKGIRLGRKEQEIVGEMEGFALANGWGTSFPTILTQHGEVFHCHSHEHPVVDGKLMVVDAGLESNEHYSSDFTRTYPTGGRFSTKQKEIYRTVYECNNLAFEMTKPGVSYKEVHLAACRHMLDNLSAIGLVRGDLDEMLAEGIAGLFMPHGLGHNMGLDVHDMEDYGEDLVGYDSDQTRSGQLGLGSLRMARRLTPGNVISDEPGIYFIPDLIELWKNEGTDRGFVNYNKLKEYYDFGGIRVEDDVLVTEDGARRLGGTRLPASPDEVEEAMAND
ncbi:MAG: Xaa-Pro aminopeptidase [Bacteroidales bacterium]|nr:Xaa-Pro aminopeptidase [Bacteroidales bacterium]